MKRTILMALCVMLCMTTFAATYYANTNMPQRTEANISKYSDICKRYIRKDMKGMYRKAGDALKYPFLTPGSLQYNDILWDWDSWLSDVALRQILLDYGTAADSKEAIPYEQGCVLNYLNYGGTDGWIHYWIERHQKPREEMMKETDIYRTNMHKPMLAQHAAFICKQNGGDAEWLRGGFVNLQAFVDKYWNYHRHKATGLLYWEDDKAIGVDNDPSTFYRPKESSGSVFLNSLMYKELDAMVYLANQLNMPQIAKTYQAEADELKASIQKHLWDPRDGFYYSVDLNILPVEKPQNDGTFHYHVGAPRSWDCLIQRISVWSGFMPMWAGIATKEQAKEIVERQFRDTLNLNSPAGIRTLSRMEKMYDVRATNNPSTWLGPIWINVNWFVFRAMLKYGYNDEAREVAEKTVLLLGKDFERNGVLHEYYIPEDGEPVINPGFQNWNYLVLNMIAWLEGRRMITEY